MEEKIISKENLLKLCSDLLKNNVDVITPGEKGYAKIKSENEPHIVEIKGKIDTLGVSIAELTARRNEIMATVPKAILRTYDYILKRRKTGQVLSFVKGDARTCSVCFKILEPQLINEIRKGAKMITCQNCGSIFIWKNEDI